MLLSITSRKLYFKALFTSDIIRTIKTFNRPGPQPLGDKQAQKEFEELIRQHEISIAESDNTLHPDVIQKATPQFEGETNPNTGETGGPKTEPVKVYVEGDWSFNGRVTDF